MKRSKWFPKSRLPTLPGEYELLTWTVNGSAIWKARWKESGHFFYYLESNLSIPWHLIDGWRGLAENPAK